LKEEFEVLHVVLGVVNDKDLNEISFVPKSNYYFCKPNIPRGLDVLILKQKLTFDLKEKYTFCFRSQKKH
jgi:dihydrofolate synthase/folylpolyglutamate synthase